MIELRSGIDHGMNELLTVETRLLELPIPSDESLGNNDQHDLAARSLVRVGVEADGFLSR